MYSCNGDAGAVFGDFFCIEKCSHFDSGWRCADRSVCGNRRSELDICNFRRDPILSIGDVYGGKVVGACGWLRDFSGNHVDFDSALWKEPDSRNLFRKKVKKTRNSEMEDVV